MDADFFKRVVSALDSPIYVTDTEGIILYVNPAFERITGYSSEEVTGKKTSIIKSGMMPESYYKRLWSTLLSGGRWKEEIINRRKSGEEYTVLQYVTPVTDGTGEDRYFAAVQYDITREKELKNEREIFFDVSVDLFCILDHQGMFKQLNRAWSDILGWEPSQLEMKPAVDFLHPEDKENFMTAIEKIFKDERAAPVDVRIRTEDGSYRWVSVRIRFNKERGLYYASGRDIQKRVEMEEMIRESSVTDALTGAYNRLKFNEEMVRETARAKRYGTPCSLVFFDIDHFKSVNDTYGHTAGDRVLTGLAALVKSLLRESDLLFRWGGEEFAILCPNTNGADALALAERVRRGIEAETFDKIDPVTVSLGTGSYNPSADSLESFLKRIDKALYDAKNGGRNRTVSSD